MKDLGALVEIDVKVNEHICHFENEIIDDKYLVNGASCTHEAKYYKSCNCGEAGDVMFVVGNKLEHNFTEKVVDEKYLYSDASCIEQAKYYYSCSCGEKGNLTFEHGSLLPHTYKTDCECLDKECIVCHTHQNGTAHNFGSGEVIINATAESEGKIVYTCSDCGAIMTDIIPTQQKESGCAGSVYSSLCGIIMLLTLVVFVSYKKKNLNLD